MNTPNPYASQDFLYQPRRDRRYNSRPGQHLGGGNMWNLGDRLSTQWYPNNRRFIEQHYQIPTDPDPFNTRRLRSRPQTQSSANFPRATSLSRDNIPFRSCHGTNGRTECFFVPLCLHSHMPMGYELHMYENCVLQHIAQCTHCPIFCHSHSHSQLATPPGYYPNSVLNQVTNQYFSSPGSYQYFQIAPQTSYQNPQSTHQGYPSTSYSTGANRESERYEISVPQMEVLPVAYDNPLDLTPNINERDDNQSTGSVRVLQRPARNQMEYQAQDATQAGSTGLITHELRSIENIDGRQQESTLARHSAMNLTYPIPPILSPISSPSSLPDRQENTQDGPNNVTMFPFVTFQNSQEQIQGANGVIMPVATNRSDHQESAQGMDYTVTSEELPMCADENNEDSQEIQVTDELSGMTSYENNYTICHFNYQQGSTQAGPTDVTNTKPICTISDILQEEVQDFPADLGDSASGESKQEMVQVGPSDSDSHANKTNEQDTVPTENADDAEKNNEDSKEDQEKEEEEHVIGRKKKHIFQFWGRTEGDDENDNSSNMYYLRGSCSGYSKRRGDSCKNSNLKNSKKAGGKSTPKKSL